MKKKLKKNKDICPKCGDKLYFIEGCNKCMSCGYSACEISH